MGTDDDRALGDGIQFFFCPENFRPPGLDIFDHFFIVDDRAVGIDPPGSVPLQLSVYCFHGTLHTEAEAGGFC